MWKSSDEIYSNRESREREHGEEWEDMSSNCGLCQHFMNNGHGQLDEWRSIPFAHKLIDDRRFHTEPQSPNAMWKKELFYSQFFLLWFRFTSNLMSHQRVHLGIKYMLREFSAALVKFWWRAGITVDASRTMTEFIAFAFFVRNLFAILQRNGSVLWLCSAERENILILQNMNLIFSHSTRLNWHRNIDLSRIFIRIWFVSFQMRMDQFVFFPHFVDQRSRLRLCKNWNSHRFVWLCQMDRSNCRYLCSSCVMCVSSAFVWCIILFDAIGFAYERCWRWLIHRPLCLSSVVQTRYEEGQLVFFSLYYFSSTRVERSEDARQCDFIVLEANWLI